MQAFLLGNLSNGGILELMMRFLKSMGHRFLLRWPPGLAEVVLSTYHSWRRHSASLPNPLLRDCSNRHIQVGLRGALAPLPWRRTAASRGNAGAFRAPRGGGAPAHRCSGAPGQQPLLGHSWDCLLAASARVCSPGAGWSGGGAELWSLDGLLGHFLAVPPWLGWHLLTAEPQLPGVRGSHAPTPGAVRAEGLCLAGGRATSCMGWSPGPEAGGSHRCS